mgnify:CR=1 FL=1
MAIDFSGVRFMNNGEPFDAEVLNRPIQDVIDRLEFANIDALPETFLEPPTTGRYIWGTNGSGQDGWILLTDYVNGNASVQEFYAGGTASILSLELMGDQVNPGTYRYYGTSSNGVNGAKGWYQFSSIPPTNLGASVIGGSVFTAANTDAAQTALGAGEFGKSMFMTNSVTSARSLLGAGSIGGSIFTSSSADSIRNLIDVDFLFNEGTTGSYRFPGGFLVNWGTATVAGNNSALVTWDTPFTTACYHCFITPSNSVDGVNTRNYTLYTSNLNTSNGRIYCNGSGTNRTVRYISIGK